MVKQRNKRIGVLVIWSFIYVTICSTLLFFFVYKDNDPDHRTHIIITSIVLLSVFAWFVLMFGFLKFDGSNNTWWSKIMYELFPYKDKKKRGTMFKDVVYPTLTCCIFILVCLFPLLFFIVVLLVLIGYILLYNPIDFLFFNSRFGLYALISLAITAVMLAVSHSHELKRSNIRYNRLAIIRTAFCMDIYAIGCLLLLTGIIEGYFDVSSFMSEEDSSSYPLGYIPWKPVINLLPGALLLYYCRKNLNFLLYGENNYYLYLRSFQYDEKEDYLMSLLPGGGKQIMKIGNPSSLQLKKILSNRSKSYDVLYLPSSNWQKHLDYYINKAYSIISVVDDTQGVIWEMFQHPEYYDKIVFYVDSNEKLNKLETIIAETTDSDLSPQLYCCVQSLNMRNISTPFVFWIKQNRCYYDTDVTIVSSLLSTKLDHVSEFFFDIDSKMDQGVLEEKTKDVTIYEDWNKLSNIVSGIRKVSKFISAILPLGIFLVAFLCSFLFCFMLTIGAVWFGVKEIIDGDVLGGVIAIVLGVVFTVGMIWGVIDNLFR